MDEIEFVKEQLNIGNYVLLDEKITIGSVYKVNFFGSLKNDGLEISYLYLPKGSGIKLHTHVDNLERYLLICGSLKVNSKQVEYDICTLNKSHNIAPVSEDTIIQTCKIGKHNLSYLYNINNGSFDNIVNLTKILRK